MLHLTPIQTARAIAKLFFFKENWSLAAVARELHSSKTCRRWQENRLERPIGKVSLPKFTFILINYFSASFLLKIIYYYWGQITLVVKVS
jgi:hypothetical protein